MPFRHLCTAFAIGLTVLVLLTLLGLGGYTAVGLVVPDPTLEDRLLGFVGAVLTASASIILFAGRIDL